MLNFDYFDEEPAYHQVFKILHVESHKSYFEDLELHFIELHKFDDENKPIRSTLDRWVKFLKRAHGYDQFTFPEELRQEAAIEKAFLSLTSLSLDEDERAIYDARLKWLRDEDAALQKALEKGIEQGIEKIAVTMLKLGKSVSEISLITGLSEQIIKTLKKESG